MKVIAKMIGNSHLSIELGDEVSYIEYAERFIYQLQKGFRSKKELDDYAVIEKSALIEELLYSQAVGSHGPSNIDNLWDKKESIIWYQSRCEKILKQIVPRDFGLLWRKYFDDPNVNILLQNLLKDENKIKPIKPMNPKRKQPTQTIASAKKKSIIHNSYNNNNSNSNLNILSPLNESNMNISDSFFTSPFANDFDVLVDIDTSPRGNDITNDISDINNGENNLDGDFEGLFDFDNENLLEGTTIENINSDMIQ